MRRPGDRLSILRSGPAISAGRTVALKNLGFTLGDRAPGTHRAETGGLTDKEIHVDVAPEVTQRSAVPYAGIPVWVTMDAVGSVADRIR